MEEISSVDLLLIRRVEHRPAGRRRRECRYLGEWIPVTEARGERRWRRVCGAAASGRAVTEGDWPACAAFVSPPFGGGSQSTAGRIGGGGAFRYPKSAAHFPNNLPDL